MYAPTLPGLSEFEALATLTPADADRFRIVVTPDDSPLSPLDGDGAPTVVALTDRYSRGFTPESGTDPIALRYAVDRFTDVFDREAAASAAVRWARIFHGIEVARWEPRGASQSEWGDGLVYLDTEAGYADTGAALAAWLHELSAWYAGEVYGVRVERRTADGDWQTVDDCDVWGFYLDPWTRSAHRLTAADVAVQEYGFPREFAESLTVVYA